MEKFKNIPILLILIFSLILRTISLDRVPPELFGDELDVGYHAYSLLKTGRDYYGQFLPTYIHSFSEWRAPFLMYATVPFIAIFGLNEWGVRLPSAIFGTLSVLLMFLIVKFLLNRFEKSDYNHLISLSAAFFLAISPWHLHYSRASFEVSLLLTLILGGFLFFLKSFQRNEFLILSSVFFALTFYTYSTANLFTPLFLILIILTFKNEIKKKGKKLIILSASIFLLLTLPNIYNIFFGHASDRFRQFSVFDSKEITQEIISKRYLTGNTLIEKIAHNKIFVFNKRIISNYLSSFSPQFLFTNGDPVFRHSLHMGEFYLIFLPLLIIGFYSLFKLNFKLKMFLLGLIFISPIPSSLTIDGAFHATRLFLMIPGLVFLFSLGIKKLLETNWNLKTKGVVFLSFYIILSIEFGFYLHEYFVHYPLESWRWWQIGYKKALTFMKSKEKDYDILIFNNTYEPAFIRFLFWWQYPPDKFIKEFDLDYEKENILKGFKGFKLTDKYYFGSAKDYQGVISFVKPNMLYLVSQRDEVGGDWDWEENPPQNIKVLETVRNPYGEPIFYVVTGI